MLNCKILTMNILFAIGYCAIFHDYSAYVDKTNGHTNDIRHIDADGSLTSVYRVADALINYKSVKYSVNVDRNTMAKWTKHFVMPDHLKVLTSVGRSTAANI